MNYLRQLKIRLVPGEYKNPVKGQVKDPKQIYRVFRAIKDKNQEVLIGIYLNESLEVNAYDTLSIGGESVSLVAPDEIFTRAIITRSRNIILIHNHPSGNPLPSRSDMEVMNVLKRQAKILKRRLLDFIIVGDGWYWSMFEEAQGESYMAGEK